MPGEHESLLASLLAIMFGLLSLCARKALSLAPRLHGIAAALRLSPSRKVPKGLPHLDVVEKVSAATVRVLGLNPGPYTLQGTNTYLIGTGLDKILVDTGEAETAEAYVSQLFDFVFPATGTVGLSHILVTHGHGDHQGGVSRLLAECAARGLPLPAVHKHRPPGDRFPLRGGVPCEDMVDGQIFCTEGATLRVLLTPGHCSDHASLVLQEDSAVLSGDCVLGCGSTVFEDLHTYMGSLRRLLGVMQAGVVIGGEDASMTIPLTNIYPGHGPVISGKGVEKVKEYINHRELREQQILSAMSAGSWVCSWALMRAVYRDALGQMPLLIQGAAQGSTIHHLEKLAKDGAVETKWPDLWRLRKPA